MFFEFNISIYYIQIMHTDHRKSQASLLQLHVDMSADVEENYSCASPGMPGGDFWRDDALMHHFRYIYGVWKAYSRETILRKFPGREQRREDETYMEADGSLIYGFWDLLMGIGIR